MRRALLLAAAVAGGAWAAAAVPALGAVRQVSVGNFYYDDDTPGDGVVEAQAGDQLRFVVLDGGPGTPHTVEVDELGIHSGALGAGETFTTPVLNRPGTYRLYCRPHDQRGHVATLVVRGTTAPTTTATTAAPVPTTTAATVATTTTAPKATTTTTAAPRAATTTTSKPSIAGSASPATTTTTSVAVPTAPTESAAGAAPGPETIEPPAPVGRGAATAEEIAGQVTKGNSQGAVLGRRAAQHGPWTRSVRMGLALLLPMALLAAGVAARSSRLLRRTQSPSRISPLSPSATSGERLAG